jgi:lysozyme
LIQFPDISHFEKVNDWTVIKQNDDLVICKATQALDFLDPSFPSDWVKAKGSGIKRGAYHVLDMKYDPIEQAKFFLQYVGQTQPSDLLALDWEQSVNRSVENGAAACMKFLDVVAQSTGKMPIFYGSYFETQDMKFPDSAASNYRLWLARYGVSTTPAPAPWDKVGWTFWQWTESGTSKGIGAVDLNYFNGTLEQLNAL